MEATWPDVPFAHADLASLGVSSAELRAGQRRGEVRTVVRGVFASTDLDDTIELRTQAVARAVPLHQVVTDRTAAWLHGVNAFEYAGHGDVPEVETCAFRWKAPTTLPGVDGRTRDLRPRDLMRLHGVLVTTPLRTALDLGCCLKRREAFAAMVMLARRHGLTKDDLVRELGRYRRRRGVIQLRSLAGLVDPRIESQREAWVYLALADAGLPLPEPQVWIEVGGVPAYRLDFAYRRRRICIEYDGEDAHQGREAYDEERRDWLRSEGWTVIVVRRGDFTAEALDRWLATVRTALASDYSTRRW